MRWGIALNEEHVALWRRRLYAWWLLMAFGYFTTKGARFDELLFVSFAVPAAFLAAYAPGCLLIAAIKVLWAVRRDGPPSVVRWQRVGGGTNRPQCR